MNLFRLILNVFKCHLNSLICFHAFYRQEHHFSAKGFRLCAGRRRISVRWACIFRECGETSRKVLDFVSHIQILTVCFMIWMCWVRLSANFLCPFSLCAYWLLSCMVVPPVCGNRLGVCYTLPLNPPFFVRHLLSVAPNLFLRLDVEHFSTLLASLCSPCLNFSRLSTLDLGE